MPSSLRRGSRSRWMTWVTSRRSSSCSNGYPINPHRRRNRESFQNLVTFGFLCQGLNDFIIREKLFHESNQLGPGIIEIFISISRLVQRHDILAGEANELIHDLPALLEPNRYAWKEWASFDI